MELLELAQELIRTPSYVALGQDGRHDEVGLAEFLLGYLKGLGTLEIQVQSVEEPRFNIVAWDGAPPRLVFCCHMDTVPYSGSWNFGGPFSAHVAGDRLYGLGASDMKGGVAAVLDAVRSAAATQGLLVLIDVDEEYYFKGIETFCSDGEFLKQFGEFAPELVVLPEPGLQIHNRHRGIIELDVEVQGASAHSSKPHLGSNAILAAGLAIENVLAKLDEMPDHPQLGKSTCNVAWISGGFLQDGNVARQPNKIPDYAKFTLDIRPAQEAINAEWVARQIEESLAREGCTLLNVDVRIDYGSLCTPPGQLEVIRQIFRANVDADPSAVEFGYFGEGAIIQKHFADVPCVYIGPGPSTMAHQVNEYVSIKEMEQASRVYGDLIQHYCQPRQ